MIRLMLLEDDPVVGTGEQALFRPPEFEVVGLVRALDEAVELATRERPDVIVSDVMLDGLPDGLELPARLAGTPAANASIVFFSSFEAPYFIARAVESGAAGYVVKSSEVDELLSVVRIVANGGVAFPAAVLRAATKHRPPAPREIEILELAAAGASNLEISTGMGLSEKTVETYLARMYARYRVGSRTEMAMYALRQGWITMPDPIEHASAEQGS